MSGLALLTVTQKPSSKVGMKMSLPPRIDTTVYYKHVFRYQFNTTQSGVGITGQMMAGAFGGVCTVANLTLGCWTSTIRIKKLVLWPSVTTSASPVEISWRGPVTQIRKDTSPIVTMPAGITMEQKLVSAPPKGSFCDDWISLNDLGSQQLFVVTGNAGSVLDVHVAGTLGNNITRYNLGITTGTQGSNYYTALDGPGANHILPVGLPTTA
jgi:hypothetical protein